jgi:radical SAM superfamily enzyme YgiQ (UPF0313 family)
MRVVLVSTYELGHQPLHVASPAEALRHAGHEVRTLDVSVERWDVDLVAWADAVAFSVPMHTAMRLAMEGARVVKQQRAATPICFYGLYAVMSHDVVASGLVDHAIAGEYEAALVRWVDSGAADITVRSSVELGRSVFRRPYRASLPPLARYAHLVIDGEERPVGYVEASHGCSHRCRHCPIPVIYDGRIRVVAEDVVLDDVAHLVAAGARHITFGDPDFLNGVHHSRRVVDGMHQRFPSLTFDCTVKVEHVLRHGELWASFAEAGCLFVVSALETVNNDILARLDKGHTAAQGAEAVVLLRRHGIEMRPSLLPFTPWTTFDDVLDILDFVADHDLIANVDPVQYTIRLLLPERSLLLDDPDLVARLGPYDPVHLSYTWEAAHPALDTLQRDLAGLVGRAAAAGQSVVATFMDVNATVRAAARSSRPAAAIPIGSTEGRPRLSEPWFC